MLISSPSDPPGTSGQPGKRARRMADLLDLVRERGSVSVADLADGLRTSAATIRRDLAVLADQGVSSAPTAG